MEEVSEKEALINTLEHYEKTLTYRHGHTIHERLAHILGEYRKIADSAIFQAKNFAEDVKTQFKALEIITEGLTDGAMNHGQKRVVANHIINMLRKMVDRLDQLEYGYNTNILERYNFFRSYSPERRLYEEHSDLKRSHDRQSAWIKTITEKYPEVLKAEQEQGNDLPF